MLDACAVRCRDRIADLAGSSLASARTEGDLVRLLEAVWAVVGEELARVRPADAPAPACGPGCASCCRVNVGTLAFEGAVAAAFLRRGAPPRAHEARAATLHAFHDRVRWLEDRERATCALACPLLDAHLRCGIHAARPLACRSVSSLDAAECRAALAGGDEEDGPALVRMDLAQRALHDEARAALGAALAARGLDARHRDVSGMTAAFLADPQLVEAFLAGERVPIE
jgi:Fe-S-cluster containining protein